MCVHVQNFFSYLRKNVHDAVCLLCVFVCSGSLV